jgi:hypothetical protein
LEWVVVRLSKDYNEILSVGFAAHGHVTFYEPQQVHMENSHPMVHCALSGHASHNCYGNITVLEHFKPTFEIPHVLATADILSHHGIQWRPHESGSFVLLGLDDDGNPINDQKWVKFRGRFGKCFSNTYFNCTYLNGLKLKPWDHAYVRFLCGLALGLRLVPRNYLEGNGPLGFGARQWVWLNKYAAN